MQCSSSRGILYVKELSLHRGGGSTPHPDQTLGSAILPFAALLLLLSRLFAKVHLQTFKYWSTGGIILIALLWLTLWQITIRCDSINVLHQFWFYSVTESSIELPFTSPDLFSSTCVVTTFQVDFNKALAIGGIAKNRICLVF